jgi:hypothetical protein
MDLLVALRLSLRRSEGEYMSTTNPKALASLLALGSLRTQPERQGGVTIIALKTGCLIGPAGGTAKDAEHAVTWEEATEKALLLLRPEKRRERSLEVVQGRTEGQGH